MASVHFELLSCMVVCLSLSHAYKSHKNKILTSEKKKNKILIQLVWGKA